MTEIENFLNNRLNKNKSPSIQYSFFNQENIVYNFCGGYSDFLNKKKINDNTTYNAYSVTKTFTALAILQLAEDGKLKIDDTVIKYLPDFVYRSEITIRQLLSHSAGLPNPIPLAWIHLENEHSDFDRNAFFKKIFKKHNKKIAYPNDKFAYSNLGYVLLGQVIEKIAGLTYENYIQNNILQPLNLQSKDLGFEIYDDNLHAKGYQWKISVLNFMLGFFINKSKFMNPAEGSWKPFKNNYVNGAPYGGLIGNHSAFIKYIQELLNPNCKLLSEEYKKMLFVENLTNKNDHTGMCLSWFKGELNGQEYFTHAGGGGGYYCEIRIYPDLNLGSVIMFNRSGIRDERFLDKLDKYFMP